jgi:hypothetical protein
MKHVYLKSSGVKRLRKDHLFSLPKRHIGLDLVGSSAMKKVTATALLGSMKDQNETGLIDYDDMSTPFDAMAKCVEDDAWPIESYYEEKPDTTASLAASSYVGVVATTTLLVLVSFTAVMW